MSTIATAPSVIIAMGTIASTARVVIDDLREEGKRIGLVKLKCYRPFPVDDIRALAKKYHAIGVIDRNVSLVRRECLQRDASAIYDLAERPKVLGFHTAWPARRSHPK